jgi:hypothetical protein
MAFTDRLNNRGSVSTGYDIDNSCKFESNNSEYLSKTPSSAGNQKTWTFSAWVKRTELGGTTSKSAMIFGSGDTYLHFTTSDKLIANLRTGGTNFFYYSERVFRDTSAWYHFVLACDTTQSTATDRLKLYVNGVYESPTESNGYTNIAQNANTGINSTNEHEIGKYSLDETTYAELFNGYMAEMHLVDGTALDHTSFGEFDDDSGIWKPKEYDGTYGSNGFYLDFKSSSDLGADASGNGNNWTKTNITSADQATDTPTNNFCTLNVNNKASSTIITDGATNCDRTDNANNTVRGTYHLMKGKWYFEVAMYRGTINANYPFVGWTGNNNLDPGPWVHQENKTWSISAGTAVTDVSTNRLPYGTAPAQDPNYGIYGIAFDIDNKTVLWHTNGTYNNSGNTYSVTNATTQAIVTEEVPMTPFLFMFTGANQSFNFGGYSVIAPSSAESDANGYGTFEYPVPSGYYAICSKNVAQYG